MKMILSKLSNTLNNHLLFPRKAGKYLTAIAATIFISCFLIQPASAGRPPGKQRIYLGNFNAPALIPLTGVLIPGSTAVGSVGDQVTIDAELFTSDPNEDGEGEPLVLISLPSLNSGISHYYEQKRFTFNIAKAGQTLAANKSWPRSFGQ